MGIPVEIWLWIAQRLDTMGAWFNFCCTCRLFAAIGRDLTRAAKKRLARCVVREGLTASGRVMTKYYELANGERHGHFINIADCLVTEVDYVDGQYEGVYRKRHGFRRVWDREGELIYEKWCEDQ